MTIKRPVIFSTILVLLGAVVAVLWVRSTGSQTFLTGLTDLQPVYLLPLLSVTAVFIFFRFIRWQFLLRMVGVRLPIKPSLSGYLASLAGTATPAYVGELIRSVFVRRRFGVPIRQTWWVVIIERPIDVFALGLIGVAAADSWLLRGLFALFLAGAVGVAFVGGTAVKKWGLVPPLVVDRLRNGSVLGQALLISLAAWVPAALLFTLAGLGVDEIISPITSMRTFSRATLLGGLTLMPAGVGSTGSFAIFMLEQTGLFLAQAVVVVSIVRITSTGVALLVSFVFLLNELLTREKADAPLQDAHFDEIAAEYDDQFKAHIWDYLLDRKMTMMTEHLSPETAARGVGLDLGCGLGMQAAEMARRGYRVVGMDYAHNLVQRARQSGVAAATANALTLPFADGSLDFVYTIGVLHHLPSPEAQATAVQEVRRVLKPGGVFMIHETNPRNHMFRFYMGYVFPIMKSIDEGIEHWIYPQWWREVEGLALKQVEYFTFLPDFIPQFLMRPFRAIERRLEASRLHKMSVHYLAVLTRE